MATVIVTGMNSVTIDGAPAGNVCDAFLNNRDQAGAIYDALTAYEATLRQATADAVTAGQADTAAVQLLLDEATTAATTAATVASAAVTAANDRATTAESCQQAHWTLSSILMSKGDCAAAAAAVKEINRINAAREKADLLAKVAALPAD